MLVREEPCVLVGWAHVVYIVWVVSSDGQNMGVVTYLRYSFYCSLVTELINIQIWRQRLESSFI